MSYTVVISALYLACGVFIFLLGLTILRIGQDSAPMRAAALMLFFAGAGPLLSATGIIMEQTLREGAVVYRSMVEDFEYVWEFFFPSLLLFSLSFPREKYAIRRFPVIGLLLFLPYAFHLAVMMFGDDMLGIVGKVFAVFPQNREVSLGSRKLAFGGVDNVVEAMSRLLENVHRRLFSIVNIGYAATALWILRRSSARVVNPRIAGQMKTVVAGLSVGISAYAAIKVLSWAAPGALHRDARLALINFSLVASGGTIAYAVVRRQFLGVRFVIRRGALYSTIALMFALVYLVVVRPISDFFGQYSDVGKDSFEAIFVILTVIAFQPTMIRMEELLESVLLRGRSNLVRRFKQLGAAVAASGSRDELERTLIAGFAETLDAAETRLFTPREGGSGNRVAGLLREIREPILRRQLAGMEAGETGPRPGRARRWRRHGGGETGRSVLEWLAEEWSEVNRFEVLVPLMKNRALVGFVALTEKIYGVPYTTEELSQLSVLSTQVATALDNLRLIEENLERKLFEEELKIARRIQLRLLPTASPALPGYQLSAVSVPSRAVGGDYYDYVEVENRWLVVAVADVSGKGIPAAILTATLQAAVRSNADAQLDPAEMLGRLNRLLYRNTSAAEFATFFYGVLDLKNGVLRYANAGHDFPYVVNGGGARALSESGIVLGCLESFPYQNFECDIPEGGALVVYTDGVTDSESAEGEAFGTARLAGVLERENGSPAPAIRDGVVEAVRGFGTGEFLDDLTLVVLKRATAGTVQ